MDNTFINNNKQINNDDYDDYTPIRSKKGFNKETKGLKTNKTVRFGGYNQNGTVRNCITNGLAYWNDDLISNQDISYSLKPNKNVSSDNPNYMNTICYDATCRFLQDSSLFIKVKYDSKVRCCQKCGGSRLACIGLFFNRNQYGKGIYRHKVNIKSYIISDYYDYCDSLYDYDLYD